MWPEPTREDDAAVDAALENFGVEAPDDATFVVHLSHPATYFVSIATLWVTAPHPRGLRVWRG